MAKTPLPKVPESTVYSISCLNQEQLLQSLAPFYNKYLELLTDNISTFQFLLEEDRNLYNYCQLIMNQLCRLGMLSERVGQELENIYLINNIIEENGYLLGLTDSEEEF